MSLFAQDVKLYISKKGSTDTSITSIETCKGETVLLKLEPKGLIQSYAFEIYDGVKWTFLFPNEDRITLEDSNKTIVQPINPKNSISYRVNYLTVNSDQSKYSNSVIIKLKNCTVK
jgi:hypothetical protein